MRSTGATGQLCDVLTERRQLEALDGREIGKDRLREVIDRKSLPDRKCRRLDAVGTLGREDMRAKQPAAARVHELDEPAGIAGGERARHLVETDRRDTRGRYRAVVLLFDIFLAPFSAGFNRRRQMPQLGFFNCRSFPNT
jgi:hypothetical protein